MDGREKHEAVTHLCLSPHRPDTHWPHWSWGGWCGAVGRPAGCNWRQREPVSGGGEPRPSKVGIASAELRWLGRADELAPMDCRGQSTEACEDCEVDRRDVRVSSESRQYAGWLAAGRGLLFCRSASSSALASPASGPAPDQWVSWRSGRWALPQE